MKHKQEPFIPESRESLEKAIREARRRDDEERNRYSVPRYTPSALAWLWAAAGFALAVVVAMYVIGERL